MDKTRSEIGKLELRTAANACWGFIVLNESALLRAVLKSLLFLKCFHWFLHLSISLKN